MSGYIQIVFEFLSQYATTIMSVAGAFAAVAIFITNLMKIKNLWLDNKLKKSQSKEPKKDKGVIQLLTPAELVEFKEKTTRLYYHQPGFSGVGDANISIRRFMLPIFPVFLVVFLLGIASYSYIFNNLFAFWLSVGACLLVCLSLLMFWYSLTK